MNPSGKRFRPGRLFRALLALCVLSFAGHLVCWPGLPEQVPCHWGADGQINGWMHKNFMLLLDLLPLGLLLLFQLIPRIDPKGESYRKSGKIWPLTQTLITVLMVGVTWSTELSVWGLLGDRLLPATISCAVGILLITVGNYMPQVKQNYTMGVKTPWALHDEHCWQRSQHMGGIVFVLLGIYTILMGCTGSHLLELCFGPISIGGIVWLYVYSYLVYIGKMK